MSKTNDTSKLDRAASPRITRRRATRSERRRNNGGYPRDIYFSVRCDALEKIMSKSPTPTPDLVRELRNDELEKVSGGYVYNSTYVMGIVAAQTKTACTQMANADYC